jgi:16S rRNA (uracil1498-N3)-methyltransferase
MEHYRENKRPLRGTDVPPRHSGRYDAAGDPPLSAESLTLQVPFQMDGNLARRLMRREVNPKEAFTIRDGQGVYFRASLKELNPSGGTAVPYERLAQSPEPTVDITLACAVLARQRMIFIMQKATELGVSAIAPLLTDYSVPPRGLEHEKAHAWPGQVIRAAKQCRRGSLPAVLPPMPLDKFLDSPVVTGADLLLFLDDRSESAPIKDSSPRRIVLFVGPEGGFSDAERARLGEKASPWILGGRVLRAETAVLAGLVAVHFNWGDFRPPIPMPPTSHHSIGETPCIASHAPLS